jgi:hypothetical protein
MSYCSILGLAFFFFFFLGGGGNKQHAFYNILFMIDEEKNNVGKLKKISPNFHLFTQSTHERKKLIYPF